MKKADLGIALYIQKFQEVWLLAFAAQFFLMKDKTFYSKVPKQYYQQLPKSLKQ